MGGPFWAPCFTYSCTKAPQRAHTPYYRNCCWHYQCVWTKNATMPADWRIAKQKPQWMLVNKLQPKHCISICPLSALSHTFFTLRTMQAMHGSSYRVPSSEWTTIGISRCNPVGVHKLETLTASPVGGPDDSMASICIQKNQTHILQNSTRL